MSSDPIERLPMAFGRVLTRRRDAKHGTALAIAGCVGLTEAEVIAVERGQREPTLTEFFRVARALGDAPILLMVDVITAWLDADTLRATRAWLMTQRQVTARACSFPRHSERSPP